MAFRQTVEPRRYLMTQTPLDRQAHWNNAYTTKGEAGVSWFQDTAAVSLDLLRKWGVVAEHSLIDIGGGASRLVDELLQGGMHDITVLDLSTTALDAAKAQLGAAAADVHWVAADITRWRPSRTYDFWHDRAAFHFLAQANDREAYVERICAAVKPRGIAVIATFAPDGPERCSGLEVVRYDPATLESVIGPTFELVDQCRHLHTTPWGSTQAFQFSVFRRNP